MPKTLDMTVVGMKHHISKSTRVMIRAWMKDNGPLPVKLVREPKNEYDSNAIKVVAADGSPYRSLFLGYLRATVAEEFAPAMDKRKIKLRATMTAIDPFDGTGDLEVIVTQVRKIVNSRAKRKT